jgi:hypothetical protein
MGQTQIGIIDLDFVNSRRAAPDMGGSGSNLNVAGDYASITALDTKLLALNPTYYTQARLDSMTTNDKVFAMRNMQDATSIASYMTNSSA